MYNVTGTIGLLPDTTSPNIRDAILLPLGKFPKLPAPIRKAPSTMKMKIKSMTTRAM